jgi:diguanylate cyclase (GGDEF)-like protein
MPDTTRPDTRTRGREDGRGLYSVAQIQHVLRVEFTRAQRYHYPIVCLMIAIDQLGALRDKHGYEAKESVFEAVVVMLEDATRGSDFLGRTADDRLLAVLPHTDIEGARSLAARLFREIAQLDLREIDAEPALDAARVTLSIGAAAASNTASNEGEGEAGGGPVGMMFHDAMLLAAENALADAVAAGGGQLREKAPV